MKRRVFLYGPVATALAAPIAAHAEQAGKVYRIGLMSPRVVPPFMGQFGSAMSNHGWVKGRDFTIEPRYSGLSVERAQAAARDLVDLNVDLILTFTTARLSRRGRPRCESRAAGRKRHRPQRIRGRGLFAKYLDLLKELMPSLKRFGVFWNYVPPGLLNEEAAVGLGEIR